ncbi:hypothetical protein SAMN05421679_101118 [Epilithonimonas pallida]|uniref:Uncharacterized protein n=1 Tax=Epilithonimonas pallida TaxID=373671 RepID=A0ABY1QX24_9FLAO|nr:hypothetical protein SAMN05421679_101118 [Epilithonimonas pallida]
MNIEINLINLISQIKLVLQIKRFAELAKICEKIITFFNPEIFLNFIIKSQVYEGFGNWCNRRYRN